MISVVGGGLAGSECALQLAARGHDVVLHEMRGVRSTPAHKTDKLTELVCSNTFKSTELGNAHGLLKAEMRLLGCALLEAADAARIPAGTALAVDRVNQIPRSGISHFVGSNGSATGSIVAGAAWPSSGPFAASGLCSLLTSEGPARRGSVLDPSYCCK